MKVGNIRNKKVVSHSITVFPTVNRMEKYSLRWEKFEANVAKSYRELRFEEDFFDVTLVSDDLQQVSAHKLVLSACSEYFKTVLKQSKHQHPMLCLDGVSFSNLNSILDYIYNGETQIERMNLKQFLAVAEKLKVEGLKKEEEELEAESSYSEDLVDMDIPVEEQSVDLQEEKVKVKKTKTLSKKERKKIKVNDNQVIKVNFKEMDSEHDLDLKLDETMVTNDDGSFECTICLKSSSIKANARAHAETHFEGLTFSCTDCEKSFGTRNARNLHKKRIHGSKKADDGYSFQTTKPKVEVDQFVPQVDIQLD